MATLIQIIIALIVAGFLLWAIRQVMDLIPMDAWLKQVANVVLLIAVVAIVLFYVYGGFNIMGPCGQALAVIATDSKVGPDPPWEHVSVSINRRMPNWQEMCFIQRPILGTGRVCDPISSASFGLRE